MDDATRPNSTTNLTTISFEVNEQSLSEMSRIWTELSVPVQRWEVENKKKTAKSMFLRTLRSI